MSSMWASPAVTCGSKSPVTAAVNEHSTSKAQPFHPCFGYGSGGPQDAS